ncbi:MAG TPA: F0F1 ATP synthase subunit delta [Candidatus Saccharimonadales bacterium]|nr:F0F1 ATP synthase subunit delta [Candidatus Saccharimonadales bacterium]
MSSHSHLVEVIGAKSLETSDLHQLAREIAAYLMETSQTADMESLIRDIMAYRAKHGVVEATTTSAHTLSIEDIDDIKQILHAEYPQARSLFVNQAKDPDVIGGVRLDMPGEQLDLTVRAKVNTFKRLTTSGKEL